MSKEYNILSPDGFPISHDWYPSEEKAWEAYNEWKKRFEIQGYYSTSSRDRIPLDSLLDQCYLIEQEDKPEEKPDNTRKEFNGPVPELQVCKNCGSSDVDEKKWVSINTGKITGDCGEPCYCNNCFQEVSVINQSEFTPEEDEEDEEPGIGERADRIREYYGKPGERD